jgi:hypothetical protein
MTPTKYDVFNLWESMVADSDMKKQTLINQAITTFYKGVATDETHSYLLNLAYTFVRRYS